jgi:hypothetical protein
LDPEVFEFEGLHFENAVVLDQSINFNETFLKDGIARIVNRLEESIAAASAPPRSSA